MVVTITPARQNKTCISFKQEYNFPIDIRLSRMFPVIKVHCERPLIKMPGYKYSYRVNEAAKTNLKLAGMLLSQSC